MTPLRPLRLLRASAVVSLVVLSLLAATGCRGDGAPPARPPSPRPGPFPGACREEEWRRDEGVVQRTFFTYDKQGRLLQEEGDGGFDPADGYTDFLTTYIHDASGRLAGKELDVGVNGSVNKRHRYHYDQAGRLLREEVDWLGGYPDGTVDMWIDHRHDARGNELAEEVDGVEPTMRQRTTFSYDEPGRLQRQELDRGADGRVELLIRYRHDGAGQLLQEEEEELLPGTAAGGGSRRLSRTNRHDSRGRLVLQEVDLGQDGTIDYREQSRWDEQGNLLAREVVDPAGVVQRRVSRDYGCWER